MHWTYKFKSESDLEQGDILSPSTYIDKVLTKYHPYYATHPHNELFIVLTQSCDIVRRGGSCKAPYITLAPVRPLRVIIEREFSHHLRNVKFNAQAYGSNRVKEMFRDFLYKIFNNNDPRYFFLRKQQDKHIAEDMCAITGLSISIKSEHYAECLNARVLQLEDIFQAKLGWLVGQKYSRVGTPDWDEIELIEQVDQVLSNTAVWVDDKIMQKIKKAIEKKEELTPGIVIDQEGLQKIISEIPEKKKLAIEAIINILTAEGLLPSGPDPKKSQLQKIFLSDSVLAQFL